MQHSAYCFKNLKHPLTHTSIHPHTISHLPNFPASAEISSLMVMDSVARYDTCNCNTENSSSTGAIVQMSWCLRDEEDISCLFNLCMCFYDRKSVKMAEARVLIGGKFASDFVIQSSSPKKTTKGLLQTGLFSVHPVLNPFLVTLGDTISQPRSGLLQSFLGQAHEGCHSSAQCPFALDPAENRERQVSHQKLMGWRIQVFSKRERNARFTSTQIFFQETILWCSWTASELNGSNGEKTGWPSHHK